MHALHKWKVHFFIIYHKLGARVKFFFTKTNIKVGENNFSAISKKVIQTELLWLLLGFFLRALNCQKVQIKFFYLIFKKSYPQNDLQILRKFVFFLNLTSQISSDLKRALRQFPFRFYVEVAPSANTPLRRMFPIKTLKFT